MISRCLSYLFHFNGFFFFFFGEDFRVLCESGKIWLIDWFDQTNDRFFRFNSNVESVQVFQVLSSISVAVCKLHDCLLPFLVIHIWSLFWFLIYIYKKKGSIHSLIIIINFVFFFKKLLQNYFFTWCHTSYLDNFPFPINILLYLYLNVINKEKGLSLFLSS